MDRQNPRGLSHLEKKKGSVGSKVVVTSQAAGQNSFRASFPFVNLAGNSSFVDSFASSFEASSFNLEPSQLEITKDFVFASTIVSIAYKQNILQDLRK